MFKKNHKFFSPNLKDKVCKKCGKVFKPLSPHQIYCGSKTEKIGCSWQNILDIRKKFYDTDFWRQYYREYDKKWRKEQRKQNTPYAERQRERMRKYYKINYEYLKIKNKEWRKKNISRILFLNRQRKLKLKNIGGNHTYKEWLELKNRFNYCCAICGISEDILKIKWMETQFIKLTEDHIIPVEKWEEWTKKYPEIIFRCNDIENIQPTCVSCNSSKKDKIINL